ncbi:HNH endonuclease [Gemmatimonas groenlandica]|uniref:HNH endonuclease n=1 Tax=Gemmatimonas groenlandica TaxID=2732249 RepID=A0A6M4IMS8_9BACT|nr:HNH endonuclease [Gemmatimonas groenlandica]QJR35218.1 hypothetical protein HKW67_06725 [Gemmatimonas groenlandica]
MIQTIVLPGRENFPKSVDPAIPLSRLQQAVDSNIFREIQSRFGSRPISTWGFTPTLANKTPKNWNALEVGDRALFTGNNEAFAVARIFDKVHHPEYARQMWGPTEDGRIWEYMILLEDVQRLTPPIPYVDLNPPLGYSSTFVYPGALLLSPERSLVLSALLEERGIKPTPQTPSPPAPAPLPSRKELEGLASLDKPSLVQRRAEQQSLRRFLLEGNSTALCALCGESFSQDLLIAAHIKRRSDCSHQERLDFDHNTMLLCLFGCDALFERQYVIVNAEGTVHLGRRAETDAVQRRQAELTARQVRGWKQPAQPYFAAHAERLRQPVTDESEA